MTLKWEGDRVKRELEAALDVGMGEGASELRDFIVTDRLSGQILNVRSGQLRSGVRHRRKAPGHWQVTSSVPYGAAHEFGATITPKKGKYLSIPVGKALTASGVPRYASPRQVPDLVYIERKGKKPILAKKKRNGGLDVYFVLVKKTVLRKKRWMGSALEEQKDKIEARVASVAARRLGL